MSKKRNKYFFKEKSLIQLQIKDNEIREAIRNQSWIELDEPIPNGYYAEWVLRDDILRRDDAAAYQEALDVCKGKIWSRTIEFKYKDRKTKKWVQRNPELKSIHKDKYEKLSPTAQKFFIEDTFATRKKWKYGYNDKIYRCTLSYELVVKITKAFITHRKEHDNILYQMDAENKKMMYVIAGDNNPWGGTSSKNKYQRKYENKKEKLAAERKANEVIKIYKSINDKKDLLDI